MNSVIKIKVKSNRYPYWRGGVNFQDGAWVETEVTQEQLKLLKNDPNIQLSTDESSNTGDDDASSKGGDPVSIDQKGSEPTLAQKIYTSFKNFANGDFRKDGGLRIDAVRAMFKDETITTDALDDAMKQVFEWLEAEQEV